MQLLKAVSVNTVVPCSGNVAHTRQNIIRKEIPTITLSLWAQQLDFYSSSFKEVFLINWIKFEEKGVGRVGGILCWTLENLPKPKKVFFVDTTSSLFVNNSSRGSKEKKEVLSLEETVTVMRDKTSTLILSML